MDTELLFLIIELVVAVAGEEHVLFETLIRQFLVRLKQLLLVQQEVLVQLTLPVELVATHLLDPM